MSAITKMEIGAFLGLFIRGDKVLNFNVSELDVFSLNSVGCAICSHYKLSKVKSLTAYIGEAKENYVIKLLNDLLEHYELHFQNEIEEADDESDNVTLNNLNKNYREKYKKCRAIMDKTKLKKPPLTTVGDKLKDKFSSDYMYAQIDLMLKMQEENPTEAIGKAKEFIESCCKTILEESNEVAEKSWSVSQLTKATMKLLQISTENVDATTNEGNIVKAILGNLHGIAGQIAELRNHYGSGHGKSASYKGLTIRHAKLAVGSSITLVGYLWDTYEWRKEKAKRQKG